MSLNNLRSYNWEQGTLNNPVSITGTQFSWLINLLKKGTVTKDIRGYIQVGSPITSYEKYLVELAKDEHGQPLLHLVNPTVTPVEYTVVPQASTIKEGTSTKLNINGIGLEALKFRIVNHTNDTPDYQARTTIDSELGYVRVASAQENATWTDVVTIQACPVWEEWTDPNASIVEFDVTVNATAVTSVTITAPQYVKPGVTFNPIVNFLPVGHTKPIVNTLEDAAAKRGICFIPTSDNFTVGKTTDPTKMSAIAPNTETPVGETWSLGCGVYAFTNSQTMATPSANVAVKYPYIQFTVTTDGKFSDISTANPKITLQKVDSQDTPIGEPIVLTGQPTPPPPSEPTSLVYTYGNGNVAGDGSEKFVITAENVKGYTKTFPPNVVPNDVDTIINAAYNVIQTGIYVVYSDGSEENAADVLNRFSFASGKTPCFIRILTVDSNFAIPFESVTELTNLAEAKTANTSALFAPSGNFGSNIGAGVKEIDDANRDGTTLVNRIETYIQANTGKAGTAGRDPIFKCYEKIITMNGVPYHGYLPLWYHLRVIRMNRNSIGALLSLGNSTNQYPTTSDEGGERNRNIVFMRKGDRIMAVNNIYGNLTSYPNDGYRSSSAGYQASWSGDNCWFDSNENFSVNVSPIYFIPQ